MFQSPTDGRESQLTNGNQHWISRLMDMIHVTDLKICFELQPPVGI